MSAVTIVDTFDWCAPRYDFAWAQRAQLLALYEQASPQDLANVFESYRREPWLFISDFGTTSDPRNIEVGGDALTPFLLFPRQVELCKFIIERWRAREHGIVEKSRDVGASWVAMGLAVTLCLFNKGLVVGVASRKEDLVDNSSDPSSLFFKARQFLQYVPPMFLGGWSVERDSAHMRINFPSTGSTIAGEAGDQVGRGARHSITFLDESAFLERPELIDASLSATSNCRIDLSSANGSDNSFAIRRHSGKVKTFTFSYRDDPRKDAAWLAKQKEQLAPHIFASEILIDYNASRDNILIPAAHVEAAIGLDLKRFGVISNGSRVAGLDIADSGTNKNALAVRHGGYLEHVESFSGKGSTIFASVGRALSVCERHGCEYLSFDGDGAGMATNGIADELNRQRELANQKRIHVESYRGSDAVVSPRSHAPGSNRSNADAYLNRKAQSWFWLKHRFEQTYAAVVEGRSVDSELLISINKDIAELNSLVVQLSQPTWSTNSNGKLLIDKSPNNSLSPDLADAVVIAFNPQGHLMDRWAVLGRD